MKIKIECLDIEKRLGKKLVKRISEELNINKESMVDFDLQVYDTQPSKITGIQNEFLSSGRLDNLCSTLIGLEAIIDSSKDLNESSSIDMIAMYDNEEIGSRTFSGADNKFFADSLDRIFRTIKRDNQEKEPVDLIDACIFRSFCLSCDMAHAIHPNYQEKHQPNHSPKLHEGVVMKTNQNGRYTTDGESAAIMRELAKKSKTKIQDFSVKQDVPCGSTIGPITTGVTGLRCVDLGIPQLAMHSIREICGITDIEHCKRLYDEFFNSFEEVRGDLLKK